MTRSNDTSRKNKKHHDSSSEEDTDYEEIERTYGNKPLNKGEFKKFLNKMFSSKVDKYYESSNGKIKNSKDKKDKKDKKMKNKSKKEKKHTKKNDEDKKKRRSKRDEEDDEDVEEEYEDDEGKVQVNYLITLEPVNGEEDGYYDDYESYDEEEDSDYEEEDEDDEDSDEDDEDSEDEDSEDEDSEDEDSEDEDSEDEDSEDSEEEDTKKKKYSKSKNKSNTKDKTKNKKTKENDDENVDLDAQIAAEEENLESLKKLYKEKKSDVYKKAYKAAKKQLDDMKSQKSKKEKKHKQKNTRKFRDLLRNKNKLNDVSYFETLPLKEQMKIIGEMKKLNELIEIEKPYRLSLLEADIPPEFKAAAVKKINTLKMMEPGGGEYYKIKNWIDTFMSIPFGKYKQLEVSASDGVEKCHDFMENAKNTLDSAVYGLNDAKMQIMQLMGQFITNPSAIGSAIAIQGPMGTGKTTMVKEGISKILGRDFAFIALGGATDSSFLEGHSYTYEGSTWGQIVNILIKSKSMNPVIYFDELDKVSDTPKGEEIIGILTHLTDISQNTQFHDKYFSEIDFDLSKCLFIFSYNDITKINPILRDRMYTIQTKGYDSKEKIIISRNHILPKIREQVKFNEEDIVIEDEVIRYIIENHTMGEAGLRNLKRCYEIIYTKLNLYRLMKPGTNLFEEDMSITVQFPFTVTKEIVDKLIKRKNNNVSQLMMYC